ncbi:MAG TPA: preprotein translocase subunit SecE [Candidatus Atribacteria bacterium]|nr:preprotein translocase subunit SecE [Candidatus Atribacteria bacterium]
MQNKKFFRKLIDFIKEAIAELKKVVWPSRKDLKNSTIVVISTIIIASTFVGIIDLVFVRLLTLIIK